MVSITCPCIECEYNGRNMKCKAKSIKMTYRNMATVNEGRVDMWICDKYKPIEIDFDFAKNGENRMECDDV